MSDSILIPVVTYGLALWASTYPLEWILKLRRDLRTRRTK